VDLLARIDRSALAYAGIALLVLGTTVAVTLKLLDPTSGVRKRYAKYVAALDAELRFLFYDTPAAKIARNQVLVVAGLLVGAVFLRELILLLLAPAVAFLPMIILKRRHVERVQAIELQLDSWLLILANALKATPSLGEAIRASAKIMRKPIAQDLDLLLKEVNLGTPLDQAVLAMSNRIGSRVVAGALATILVGRQTGGDLPSILEESAATLREMQRLEGVVRTKTAEGKSQAYVLGVIPFVLIGAIHMIDPHWLTPLTETTIGYIVITVAMILWVGAIFAARKILAVDV
jgi:tight adherence protein B